jgi:hypothetical protein
LVIKAIPPELELQQSDTNISSGDIQQELHVMLTGDKKCAAAVCTPQKKALAQLKFPKELDVKVDVKALRSKPGWAVIKEWVAKRVTQILNGLEEEVLISLVINLLESDQVSQGA